MMPIVRLLDVNVLLRNSGFTLLGMVLSIDHRASGLSTLSIIIMCNWVMIWTV